MKKLSFRYKLLLTLVTLPVVSLSLFLWLAVDTFREDKLAYVFDSSLTLSVQMANQVRTEVTTATSLIRQLLSDYNPQTGTFNKEAISFFQLEKRLSYLAVVQENSLGAFHPKATLGRIDTKSRQSIYNTLRLEKGQSIRIFADDSGLSDLKILARFEGTKNDNLEVVFGIRLEELSSQFAATGTRMHVVTNRQGHKVLGPKEFRLGQDLLREMQISSSLEGMVEAKLANEEYLISYSPVGIDDLFVLSAVQKAASMKAVREILWRSVLFFLSLIGATIVIGVFASTSLTHTISILHQATRKIAAGDFDVHVPVKTQDELGELAMSFESMARQVSKLLDDTVDKARMESELLTAQTVQRTLLPDENFKNELVEVSGFYKPANECSGDWWSYNIVGDYLYLWIGDATGHGVSAALLTSAAKTAAYLSETQLQSPAQAMSMLNESICQVAKGQLMMTFFAARINLVNKTMTYSNASHNPPILIDGKLETVKKMDLQSLMAANGPRLGQSMASKYTEEVILLNENTKLIMFTDGLIEMVDPDGKMWMERNFIKSLTRANSNFVSNESVIENIVGDADKFRRGEPLTDDITFFQVHMI